MVVVIATMHAKEGQEDRMKDVLLALVVESRQEQGNVHYDLLVGEDDPCEFAIYEVWESQAALNSHLRSTHISVAHSLSGELADRDPRVVSYRTAEPRRTFHSSGPTRRLEADDPRA
jgi:quinol monooxygenase YgiN